MKRLLKKRNTKIIIAGFLFLHLIFLFNLKFTAWPEMTLWPYLITKGWLPYKDIAIAHTPLLLVDLTILYKLFGVGLLQLKIYTWLLVLLTDVLLFWVVREIWNRKTAIFSLIFFIPFQLFYEGNGLWFDLALAPMALVVFYLIKKKDYLWAGIFWTLAFLTKQTAFWLLIPAGLGCIQGISLQKPQKFIEKSKKFASGMLGTFLIAILVIWALGFLKDFYYWAFEFGIGILPKAQGQIHLPSLRQLAISFFPFSILFFLFLTQKRKESILLSIWVIAGVLGAFPRWELFHFQPALPFLAIAGGLVFSQIKKLKPITKILLIGYVVLSIVLVSKYYLREWGRETRFFEPEIKQITTYVKENIEQNDKIYVLNAWDSVYALSNTLPAVRPWIPHLPWYMRLLGIQEDIVSSLDIVRPKLIIQGEYSETGLSSYKPELIDEFIKDNYEINDNIGSYLIFIPTK
ncbi:glycosyltransferase family 39 protein [Patescibacteria group bacterium]|nr:glycosyltransferase family 39 protein [Patescibacteria group bacterium]